MNYGMARQVQDDDGDGGWHFTIKNDSRIWRHECCRSCASRLSGHPTKQLAEECLYQWALDQAREFKVQVVKEWEGCVMCAGPTKMVAVWKAATPGWTERAAFCDEHATVDNVLARVERTSTMTYS